jgi:prepilin-type N-terminal cleavage/methylation domain-containing protein
MKTKIQNKFSAAFTLIELLVVISIIGVLAAFIIGGLGAAKNKSFRTTATGELKFVEAAIENYKAKYGSYPPGNQGAASATYDPLIYNQLYYELSGVTYNASADLYTTLDGATTITGADFKTAFGVGAIVNVSKGSGDDGVSAQNFLAGLKAKQIYQPITNNLKPTTVLVASIGGPDLTYQPFGVQDANPFHYNSTNPTNNPGAYDLWIDLQIGGKPYRIGNWTAK